MDALPPEYRHEPAVALAGGDDGLDVVRRILRDAPGHLAPGGTLVVEVGHGRRAVDAAFPQLPFVWLETEGAPDSVLVIKRGELESAAAPVKNSTGGRRGSHAQRR